MRTVELRAVARPYQEAIGVEWDGLSAVQVRDAQYPGAHMALTLNAAFAGTNAPPTPLPQTGRSDVRYGRVWFVVHGGDYVATLFETP
jgi:hypothetical protein